MYQNCQAERLQREVHQQRPALRRAGLRRAKACIGWRAVDIGGMDDVGRALGTLSERGDQYLYRRRHPTPILRLCLMQRLVLRRGFLSITFWRLGGHHVGLS